MNKLMVLVKYVVWLGLLGVATKLPQRCRLRLLSHYVGHIERNYQDEPQYRLALAKSMLETLNSANSYLVSAYYLSHVLNGEEYQIEPEHLILIDAIDRLTRITDTLE